MSGAARSMTGFASVEGVLAGGSSREGARGFSLTLKSVNHRHLDLQVRVPAGLEGLEAGLRWAVKAGVKRGHVELTLSLERGEAAALVRVDEALLGAYVEAHRRAGERFGIAAEVDLNGLLRMPGVLAASSVAIDVAAAEVPVLAAAAVAVARLNAARGAEGLALVAELRAAMGRVGELAEQAGRLREEVRPAQVERLRQRLGEVLAEAGIGEERLLAEAALLVERGEIEEELVRLRTHGERFVELLEAGGELGRPLDFLLQELNREANTLLSKTGGSAGEAGLRLTEIGLAMKVELERAREQVQNLE